MGLFNSYMKEGPGVDVNAPKKRGIFLFLEILWRKLSALLKANLLYALVSIPFIAIALFFLAPQFTYAFAGEVDASLKVMYDIFFAGFIVNYFGSGPASAGYSYITRSFVRSEPVFIASDGFDKFKENFKNAMLLVIVDIVVIFLVSVAIKFYASGDGLLSNVLYVFVMVIFAIYGFAHSFMYQIMVTYECNLRSVIRNGIIFTMAKLPVCILLGLVTGFLCSLVFTYLGLFSIIVYATIGMSLMKFPLEFYAARVIEKNIEKTNSSTAQGEE